MSTTTACPDWCTRDHKTEDKFPEDASDHSRYFGAVEYGETSNEREVYLGPTTFTDSGAVDDLHYRALSSEALRDLAADMLAAAEWLEAQR